MDREYYKDLSTRAADGDAKAFSKLYELIYRQMYYTAFYTLANDEDAIEAVIGAARDGFNSISKLKNEESFELFMMKTLCARIKTRCKEYGKDFQLENNQPKIKRTLFSLTYLDRLITVLYVCGKINTPVIAAYTGITKGSVRKRLVNTLDLLEIDLE